MLNSMDRSTGQFGDLHGRLGEGSSTQGCIVHVQRWRWTWILGAEFTAGIMMNIAVMTVVGHGGGVIPAKGWGSLVVQHRVAGHGEVGVHFVVGLDF